MSADHRRDRANLLHSAGIAADCIEQRTATCPTPTITMSRDELAEIAEQFARVVSLLTTIHLCEAFAPRKVA